MTKNSAFSSLLEVAQKNDATASIKKWKKAGANNSLIQELVNHAGASGNTKVNWGIEDGQKALKNLGLDEIPKQAEKASQSLNTLNNTKFSNLVNNTKQVGNNIKTTFTSGIDKAKASLKTFGASAKSVFSGIGAILKANLPTAALIGGIALASKAIGAVSNKISSDRKRELTLGQQNIKKYQDDIDEFQKKISSVKEIQDEFNKLSLGVDNNTNKNIGLTNEEYSRYLELKKELISINGELVTGYDAEGNALIDNQSAIDSTISKYEKLIDTQKQLLVSDDNLYIQNISTAANAAKAINGSKFSDAGFLDNVARNMPSFMRTKSNYKLEGLNTNREGLKSVLRGNDEFLKQAAKVIGKSSLSSADVSELTDNQLKKIANSVENFEISGDWLGFEKGEIEKYAAGYTANLKEMESVVEEFKEGTLTNLVQATEGYDQLDSTTKNFANNFVKNLDIDTSKMTSENGLKEIEQSVRNTMDVITSSGFSKKLSEFYSLTSSSSLNAGEWQRKINGQFENLKDVTGLSENELALTLGVEIDDGNVLTSSGKSVDAMIDDLNKKFKVKLDSSEIDLGDDELRKKVSDYQAARSKREAKGSYVVGNVDLNNRPVILNDDGSYSTVKSSSMAGADGGAFDGKEIMYTPILSSTGEELDDDTMAKYISNISSKATSEEELLKLDAKGMEINGKKVQNVIEGVADSIEEANQKTEAFHDISDSAYSDEAEALSSVRDYLKDTLNYKGELNNSKDFDKIFSKDYFSSLSLDELSEAYDIVTNKNEIFTGSLEQLKTRLDNLKKYKASGLSYTLEDYKSATETADDDADYTTFVSGLKQSKTDYDSGKVGTDQFKTMAGLISPSGKTDDKNFIENYSKIKKYFTEDNKGTNRFLKDLTKQTDLAGKSLAQLDKTTGKYKINIDDTASVAKKFGMGLQPFEAMLNNLKAYGHEVSFESLTEEYEQADDYLTQWSEKWQKNGGTLGDKTGQEIEDWKQKIQQAKLAGDSIPDEWIKTLQFKVDTADYYSDLQTAKDEYNANAEGWTNKQKAKNVDEQVTATGNIMYELTGGKEKFNAGGLLKDIKIPAEVQPDLQKSYDNINKLLTDYGNQAEGSKAKINVGLELVEAREKFISQINQYLPDEKKIPIEFAIEGATSVDEVKAAIKEIDDQLKIAGNQESGYSIKLTADDTDALRVITKWNEQHPDVPINITCDDSEVNSVIGALQDQFGTENWVIPVDADTAEAASKIEGVNVMKIGDKYVAIYARSSDAETEINGLISKDVPDKNFNINGTDNATPTVSSISSLTINGKTFTITANDQSTGILGTIQSMINGIHDKNVSIKVTKTVTTIQNTVRRITDFFTGGNSAHGTASFARGTAFASGSIPKLSARALAFGSLAYAGGKDIGADKTSTSLIGELGPEMRIPAGTNRWELIGQHGAEFTKIRRGDIIFNHQQTKSLLKSGKTNGRARVHGGSSAFAHGTAFARGTSGTAYASGTKQSAIEKYAESVGNRFDFVAIKLDRLAKSVDSFANQINDFVSSTTKTKALWNQYSAVGKEISGQKSAQSRYSKEASDIRSGALKKVKKSQRKTLDTYFTRVRNGGFNINTISDDGMRQIVQEYQEAYEKMLDCKYAIQELQNEQRELFNQWLDMPLEDAQKKVDKLADSYSTLSAQMSLVSSGGSAMEILSYHEQWHINSANKNKDTNSWKTQLKNNVLVGTSYLDKPAYEYQNKLLSDAVTNTTNQVNTYIKALRTAEKNYAKYNKSGSSTQKADAKRALDELQAKVNQAAVDAAQARIDFALNSQENIKNYFDSQYSYLEGTLTKSENLFDLKEAKGLDITDVEYEERLNTIMDLRKTKLEEQAQMQKNLDAQIKKGYITKGTQEYYDLQAEIDAVGEEVTKLDISAEELKDTMRDDIFFRGLERAQKAAENLQNSLETISDLIDEDAFFDDKGNLTGYGEAYLASNIANVKSLKDSLKTLFEERETIKKLNDEGYYSETEYTEKIQENEQNIADAIKSIKSAEDTVISVIQNNAKEKIDATNDMIDAYKKALQSEKDYYEYDKNLKSSNKEIQQLQNQIAALNGVADAASRAEKARLEEQLQDAMDSRDDTIKDHIYTLKVDGLDDLSDMLDDNYEKYVKELAQDIGKIEEALKDVTNSIHSSSNDILKTWEEILNHYGISGSDLGLTDSNLTGFASGGLVKAVRKNGDSGIASLKTGEEVVVEDTVRFAGEILPKLKSVITNPSVPESSLLNDFKPSVDLDQLQSNNELNIHYDNLMEIQKIEGLADMSERDLQKLMESCYKYTNENIIKSVAKRLGIKRQI